MLGARSAAPAGRVRLGVNIAEAQAIAPRRLGRLPAGHAGQGR